MLRDIIKAVDLLLKNKLFEDKIVVFGGYFYQILLIVIKKNYEKIIGSYL